MKILFINISDIRGGSAKAAYRLGKALETKYHTTNLFLVRSKFSNDNNVLQTRRGKFQYYAERFSNIIMNMFGLQYQWLPFSPKFILQKAREFKPDVISLHNTIGGYFTTKDLIKLSEIAPIVWTLHDMWAFTNNSAHTYGNESWQQLKSFPGEGKIFPWIGIKWGSRLLKQKRKIYSKSRVTLVTPSKWMYELAAKSPVFTNKKIFQIHHGIDTSFFRPMNKIQTRNKLGIDKDAKVLLFIAEKTGKSGNKLQKILTSINKRTEFPITFIILGKKSGVKYDFKNIKIIETGYITNEISLVEYYSSADLFVYPTVAESFGLVLAEAISCGTPCITDDVGPVSEIIENGHNGIIIKDSNTDDYVESILNLLQNNDKLEEYSQNARTHAENKFTLAFMAEKYFEIFNTIK